MAPQYILGNRIKSKFDMFPAISQFVTLYILINYYDSTILFR